MKYSVCSVSKYLGCKSSTILSDEFFKNWKFRKIERRDGDSRRNDYVFSRKGVSFISDGDDVVTTIFFSFKTSPPFDGGFDDLPFSSGRIEVRNRFGEPSESREKFCDPILGEYGAWDRFNFPNYILHVQYFSERDSVELITLMRSDPAS
jgi:hypothetical protein